MRSGTVDGPRGVFHLLVPGATSVSNVGSHDEIAYTLRGGSPERHWADFDYIPATSGTYYLWVEWEAGALDYKLSVTRTSRAALALAPDADDVPGVLTGSGSLTGVVSTLADPDDVYAVGMTAGRPVTIRLTPLAPYNNNSESLAYLNLLDPDAPSLAARFGHVLAGLVLAKNSKDLASRQIAEIQYVPVQTGTHYIWVEAGSVLHGHNSPTASVSQTAVVLHRRTSPTCRLIRRMPQPSTNWPDAAWSRVSSTAPSVPARR